MNGKSNSRETLFGLQTGTRALVIALPSSHFGTDQHATLLETSESLPITLETFSEHLPGTQQTLLAILPRCLKLSSMVDWRN